MEELAFLQQEKAEAEQQLEELRFTEESQRDLVPEFEESCIEIEKRLKECNAACIQEEARLLALKADSGKNAGNRQSARLAGETWIVRFSSSLAGYPN